MEKRTVKTMTALAIMWESDIMGWTARIDRTNIKDLNSFPKTYNGFRRSAFIKWMNEHHLFLSHVDAGREYSPVFYAVPMSDDCFKKVKESLEKLEPDELHEVIHKGRKAIRVWWD
jgi:hypothetical protein